MTILSTFILGALPTPDIVPRGFWMPERASTVAEGVDLVFNIITGISIFFFVLIVAIMAYFMVKYRRVNGREAEQTVTHHTPLELTWTIVPLALVIVIFYYGMMGYIELRTVPVDAYRVHVTGQKWFWNFEHPGGCVEADILRVPVNRPVQLVMSSEDVLHSVFIPAFRVKQDVVPGRFSTLWFEATQTGVYELFCAEYCGTGHSQMLAHVIVYEEDEFEQALVECARWLDDIPNEGLHLAGARLYTRCVACHSVDGRVLPGGGPSFLETHELWGQDREMDDGRRVTVDENYVRESILNPRRYTVEGYRDIMPPFQGQLDERQLRSLVEFIRRLDEIELDERGNPIVLTPEQIRERFGEASQPQP